MRFPPYWGGGGPPFGGTSLPFFEGKSFPVILHTKVVVGFGPLEEHKMSWGFGVFLLVKCKRGLGFGGGVGKGGGFQL